MFNYIIPVFNKEDLLLLTLKGVRECAGKKSVIYVIIDGCTDRSESILDDFMATTDLVVHKIHMPNVHMLKSVNAALRFVTGGFTVVMQDDIILDDPDLETKIEQLYVKMGPRLGVVSFRLASNVVRTPLHEQIRLGSINPMIKEMNFIRSADDHIRDDLKGEYGCFYPRMSAINGPNIIPWSVLGTIGILDEKLAPYGFDDPDYCIRAMKAGYVNGLFPIRYRSDIEWGGTRRSKQFLQEVARVHKRNRQYLWQKHGDFIEKTSKNFKALSSCSPSSDLTQIPSFD